MKDSWSDCLRVNVGRSSNYNSSSTKYYKLTMGEVMESVTEIEIPPLQ